MINDAICENTVRYNFLQSTLLSILYRV